jgi:hypothetical protein
MGGAGSEMYRGLGGVVVGGLMFSTVFTLIVVPLLFSAVLELRLRVAHALGDVEAVAEFGPIAGAVTTATSPAGSSGV